MATNRSHRQSPSPEASGRDIIYIGNFFPPRVLKTILSDQPGITGFSNHNFESSILEGLNENALRDPNLAIQVLCVPRIYSYPHHNRRLWVRAENYRRGKLPVRSVSVFNMAGINKIWSAAALFANLCAFSVKRIFRRPSKGRDPEIILNIPTAYIELPILVWKKIFSPSSPTTLIIPDIPQMVSAINHFSKYTLKGRLINWLDSLSMRMAESFDRYVFLTDAMKEFFRKQPLYIVMEGIASGKSDGSKENNGSKGKKEGKTTEEGGTTDKGGTKSLLYSGTLASEFGILDLLKGFETAAVEGLELWICGSGETEPIIREAAQRNPAIKFHGLVDAAEARRLQREATVLVNPRTSAGEFTRYSFPSKVLEYMQAGKPVIMHPLPGIPEEYLQVACLPDAETPEALGREIRRVFALSDDERRELGRRGAALAATKSAPIQTARILDLSKAR